MDELSIDLKRAKKAFESAQRNFGDDDIFTAANRAFVACENIAYAILKSKFGGTSINRNKILTKLKEFEPDLKETYDQSYDLRVQADYGRTARFLPLNKENLDKVINSVRKHLEKVENDTKKDNLF